MNSALSILFFMLGISLIHSAHAEVIFLAKVQFAERIFHDILVLQQNPSTRPKTLEGSFTVPGQFTSQVTGRTRPFWTSPEGFTVSGQGSEDGQSFSFTIDVSLRAHSGFYRGTIEVTSQSSISGSILLEKIYEDDK